jgi:group I intron endonuclease
MTSGIYHIVCDVNGNEYIGRAYDVERRMRGHLDDLCASTHHNRNLQAAFKNYGEEHFSFTLLIPCPRHKCVQYEQWYLDHHRPAYNLNQSASGGSEPHHPKERRARESAAQNRPEVRARQSATKKVTQNCPEVRARLSAVQKGAQSRPEVRAKRSTSMKITMNRPEVRAKMSAVMKKRYENSEERRKTGDRSRAFWALRRAEKAR